MEKGWNGLIMFLGTDNLENSHRFYHELLGLPMYKDQGLCRIYDVPGGGKLGFCSHIKILRDYKSPIITLLTDEVDDVYNRLIKAGMKIEESPKFNPKFNIYHFFIEDPSGYSVEIQKFL